jgi:ribose/xylose/arabinose/galactoside ABC-type transport system permease subunit
MTRTLLTPTREKILALVLIVELIVFGILSPYFFTVSNLLDTSRYFSETGLIAIGMSLIIITGGIDLSVGSLLALVSVVVGFSMAAGVPLPVSIVLGLATGYLGGLFNGTLVTRLSLSPLTVTLGTMALYRGIAYAVSNSGAVSAFPDWFAYFGSYYVGGVVPLQLIVFVVVAAVVGLYLERGRFGRYIRGIGYNPRTTRFSGIDLNRVWTSAYVITGLLVAVAALIYTSRVSTSRANAGIGLELIVIAAVVLGGASIKGGSGTILGTVLGVLILAFLQQGLGLLGAPAALTLVAQGAVLLVAVFVNEFFRKRKA